MIRYIILFVIFIIISILLFVNPFNFSQEIQDTITPWATLSLALVAVLTIIHSDIKEERGKRTNRLSAILDWTTDIISNIQTIETPKPTYIRNGEETYERFSLNDKINSFNSLIISGEYVKLMALRIDKDLYASVGSIVQAIDDLLKEDWLSFDVYETRNMLAQHEQRIYGIAKKLIIEIRRRL
jgi:hypothetical protein